MQHTDNQCKSAALFENLADGLAVVEAWPTPAPRETCHIMLTDAQFRLLWSFSWRQFGIVPEQIESIPRQP